MGKIARLTQEAKQREAMEVERQRAVCQRSRELLRVPFVGTFLGSKAKAPFRKENETNLPRANAEDGAPANQPILREASARIDRVTRLRNLTEAEQHIAQGERHIAEQEDLINRLVQKGHETTEAWKLLENFYATQVLHVQHRDRIRKQLEQ